MGRLAKSTFTKIEKNNKYNNEQQQTKHQTPR